MNVDKAEVCIIGSGVAGALIADHLTKAGHNVVMLEAGQRFEPAKRAQLMQRELKGQNPWSPIDPEPEIYSSVGEFNYDLNGKRLKAVGGSTHHWGGVAYRLHESDFQLNTLYGIGEDWPIDYAELEPYYKLAEQELGVSGNSGDPFASQRSGEFPMPGFPYSYADTQVVKPACDKLGINVHSIPYARNSQAYRGRPGCQAFSTCNVCPIEAMYNADVHVRKAEASGKLQLIPQARVVKMHVDSEGKMHKVTYIRDGEKHDLSASLFVLAAHAIESIRLLLLSKNNRYPNGIANSSGTLGRYFMEHWSTSLVGQVPHTLYSGRIGFNTMHTLQFYDTPKRHKIGAFKISFADGNPAPYKLAGDSGLWGGALKQHIRDTYKQTWLAAVANIEQLPYASNRISLDPELVDAQGYAAPRIDLSVGEYEQRTLKHCRETLLKILHSASATVPEKQMNKIKENDFWPIAHHMGGCRMGVDAKRSVVDADMKAHDVDNLYIVGSSVFPTAGAMNPTLTIAALSLRTAGKLDSRLRKNII